MEFNEIKNAVQRQFNNMKDQPVFRVALDKDKLWDIYLSSFPEGTNPIFRERTEHDCSCCRSFIRSVGDMVTIKNGELVSLWDVSVGGFYQVVTDTMSEYVKSCVVDNVFLHPEKLAGVDKNYETTAEGKIITWEHFHIQLPNALYCKGTDIGTKLGEYRATHDVMLRGLQEITYDAIETVLELTAQNSLYRGTEFKGMVEAFLKLKKDFDKAKKKDLFVWLHVTSSAAVGRIRNTVIGTLLVDLSEGKELEDAVKAYEFKVAPTNYKRPTALVTPAMIAKAKETLTELGYLSALERRYAVLEDITINNVLFADRSAKQRMNDVFDVLTSDAKAKKPKNLSKIEEMTIDQFLENVLPTTKELEILLENQHSGNLVSLIAPSDLTAPSMFKWDNNFSWSYNGGVADSLRDRVAELGGRIDGALRFTHSWNLAELGRNASLMDLHVFFPGATHKDGCHDTYPTNRRVGWNRRSDGQSGGVQDVDYTAAAPVGYVPVENISFPDVRRMPEGKYVLKIHNWSLRQPTTSGFIAEIEFDGQVFQYEYRQALKQKEWVTVAEVTLKDGKFTIEHKLPTTTSTKQVWGINTNTFHKVQAVMLSPNYWDEKGVGNKHFFFMLEGCCNDGQARGFYNEFLSAELDKHRKVLEMVGSKMQTETSDNQLSGLGFSSTQRNSVTCNVKGAFTRTIKINF